MSESRRPLLRPRSSRENLRALAILTVVALSIALGSVLVALAAVAGWIR